MNAVQTEAVFNDLHRDARHGAGAKLFTVMVIDNAAGLARRAYTSHPDDYPATGSKPMRPNRWSDQVIERQVSFVANSTEEFADVFPDHPVINALGCEAVLNVPVVDNGRVIGTVNFLDAAGHFTAERVVRLESLVRHQKPALIEAMKAVAGTTDG